MNIISFRHDFPFNPTYGYKLDALLKVTPPPEPEDFTAFWQQTYAENTAIKLEVTSREIQRSALRRVLEVEYNSWGGQRVGAWITLPKDGEVVRGVVVGHGYGGREGPDVNADASPGIVAPDVAAIFPCARGFHRSAWPSGTDNAPRHVLRGIQSRDTYVHRGCVCDFWGAFRALLEVVPEAGAWMDYFGGSFGGGIGAMAVAWEKRFRRAFLEVPSFGNHPLRVTMECVGSGEAVRLYYQRHPDVLEVLKYYDSAVAARHISVPVFVSNALFDPAVPPPGQFSVYNAIQSPKELFVKQTGHFEWDGLAAENARLARCYREWLSRTDGLKG